jgi:hypothetical protein
MPDSIYLIQGDDSLVEMTEHAYDSENLLQAMLAEYPNLLDGDQMDGAERAQANQRGLSGSVVG